MTTFTKWFETFLEEKNLPFESFELNNSGEVHFIDTDIVIEAIKGAPAAEQNGIKNMLVKIDFLNGNVNHYFQHLAQALVNNY